MGMAMRPAIMPLPQKPTPNEMMVSRVSPRSVRYGCSRSSFSRRNFNGELGVFFSGAAAGFWGAGFGGASSATFGAWSGISPSWGFPHRLQRMPQRLQRMPHRSNLWGVVGNITFLGLLRRHGLGVKIEPLDGFEC